MSTHIAAEPGEIAARVLLPGDPLRATWIAETFLDDARCYSRVRGIVGFTGTFRGTPVSVQGTGMGQPSLSIYVHELVADYDVRQLVRVGSCGALTDSLALGDVVLAISASTDSSMNRVRFEGLDFSAAADFALLRAASDAAAARGVVATVGGVFSADSFYSDRPELLRRMARFGVVAVEMEANALYTLAAGRGRQALAVCTVSDHLLTGESTTAVERERTFDAMVLIALDAVLATPVA
ncbi:MAG: purine-nucleoside phosphorylase [Propionibacteriales bacterium]|nr:purine-nucleoside phosphorylase [Propionibacteriales bacterium]